MKSKAMIESQGGGAEHKFSLKGFTLAEVLITLGVIGVVAAITLPSLIKKYEEKVLLTKAKKDYAVINQLLLTMKQKAETTVYSDIFTRDKTNVMLIEEMLPLLNGAERCNPKRCKTIYIKGNTPRLVNGKYFQTAVILNNNSIRLKDGARVEVSNFVNTTNDFRGGCTWHTGSYQVSDENGFLKYDNDGNPVMFPGALQYRCGQIVFDTNGEKEPNQLGRDAFMITINDKNLEASLLTELLRTEKFTYVDHKLGDEPK